MMVTKVPDGSNFGVVESKNGHLISITEKGIDGESMINAGIFLFNEKIFAAIDGIERSIRDEYELTDALESISDQIHVIDYKGIWKDIGNPWDLITANEEYMKNNIESIEGTIGDNVTINGRLYLGKGSVIKSGTCIEGEVWIGENCTIGPNAYIRGGTVLCGLNKIGASTSPEPLQDGQDSLVLIVICGLTLCLVISTRPNLLGAKILCFARSSFISCLNVSVNFFLFSAKCISIKSTTMMPPISLNLSCLATSIAACKLTSSALASCVSCLFVLFPLLTSITCIASVCSITK